MNKYTHIIHNYSLSVKRFFAGDIGGLLQPSKPPEPGAEPLDPQLRNGVDAKNQQCAADTAEKSRIVAPGRAAKPPCGAQSAPGKQEKVDRGKASFPPATFLFSFAQELAHLDKPCWRKLFVFMFCVFAGAGCKGPRPLPQSPEAAEASGAEAPKASLCITSSA